MNAPHDEDYCWIVAEFERTQGAEGKEAAHRFLAELIRNGQALSRKAILLAANIIDPDHKTPRGRPPGSHLDGRWGDICSDFDALVARGVPKEEAYAALADEYRVQDRTIRNAISGWRDSAPKLKEKVADWEREFDAMSDTEKDAYNQEIEEKQRRFLEEGGKFSTPDMDDYIREEEARYQRALRTCPHDCKSGCRRSGLLKDRAKCPLSPSSCKQTPI